MKQVLVHTLKSGWKEGFKNALRFRFLTLAGVGLLTLLLWLFYTALSVGAYAGIRLEPLEQKADFSVVLESGYDAFTLSGLENALEEYEVISTVIPAQEWNGLALPPRLRLSFTALEDVPPVFELIDNPRYTELFVPTSNEEETEFSTVISNLLALKTGLRTGSWWLGALFGVAAFIILLIVFFFIAFTRKQEIEVAVMMGATPSFITLPFGIHGGLIGLVSVVCSMVLFTVTLMQLPFAGVGALFLYMWSSVYGAMVLLTPLLAGFAGWFAADRFLRSLRA